MALTIIFIVNLSIISSYHIYICVRYNERSNTFKLDQYGFTYSAEMIMDSFSFSIVNCSDRMDISADEMKLWPASNHEVVQSENGTDIINAIFFIQIAAKYVDTDIIDGNGTLRIRGGMCGNILKDLAVISNKRVSIKSVNGSISNFAKNNGSLGTSGDLVRSGQADLTIGWWDMYAYRLNALKALHPFSSYMLTAFFKQPSTSSIRNLYSEPFTMDVWTSIASILALGMFFGVLFHYYHRPFRDLPDVETCAVYFFGIAVQQQFHSNSLKIDWSWGRSMRIALFSVMVCFFIIWSHYFGAIIKSLMANVTPIRKFQDFGKHLTFTYTSHVNLLEALVNAKSSKEKKSVYQSLLYEQDIGLGSTFSKIFKGNRIYIDTPYSAKSALQSLNLSDLDYCRSISSFPAVTTLSPVTFYTKKGSSLAETFNRGLLLIRQRGLISRYKGHLDATNLIRCVQLTLKYDSDLSLVDVMAGFFILLGGFISAIFILLFEYGTHITKHCS